MRPLLSTRLPKAIRTLAATALLLVLAEPARAQRESAIQLTPDCKASIISKDIGDERWAITYDLERGSVTGNVYPTDGGPPSFLHCRVAPGYRNGLHLASMALLCRFAGSCTEAPCENQWSTEEFVTFFDIEPFDSFFLPPGTVRSSEGLDYVSPGCDPITR